MTNKKPKRLASYRIQTMLEMEAAEAHLAIERRENEASYLSRGRLLKLISDSAFATDLGGLREYGNLPTLMTRIAGHLCRSIAPRLGTSSITARPNRIGYRRGQKNFAFQRQ